MNTRSRLTLSTTLGIALVGVCLGSAQAQSAKTMKMHDKMMMHEHMMMEDDDMMEPAPVGYPFAAPGGLHLYHYDSYAHEGVSEGSATMKKMDRMEMDNKMMHDNMMMHDRMMMDDEEMMEPAPIGYPFSAPGGLHLYHYDSYAHEGMSEGSATMKKMDRMEMDNKMMHDNMMMHDRMMMDDEDEMEPAPVGYPFAAPGGLHLYHYDSYAHEGISEGSATMTKMEKAEKMEKKSMKRMK